MTLARPLHDACATLARLSLGAAGIVQGSRFSCKGFGQESHDRRTVIGHFLFFFKVTLCDRARVGLKIP